MWTEYKKEIIVQEKQGKKDFLKTFYHKNKLNNSDCASKDLEPNGDAKRDSSMESKSSLQSISSDESITVVLDSDEEPPPNFKSTKKEKVPLKKEVNYITYECKIIFKLKHHTHTNTSN